MRRWLQFARASARPPRHTPSADTMPLNEPMPQQYFITGTDTNAGKTVLSALLCAALDASYWKPIQTGAAEDSDSRTVAQLAGLAPDRILPEAYRFDAPVSPHLAARIAGTRIDMTRISIPEAARRADLVVEGAGGILVPINEDCLMLDLMKQLGLPVILATRSSLGTINHTLLSIQALAVAEVALAGVVMIGEPNHENRQAIEEYGRVQVLGEIPRIAELNREALLATFNAHFDRVFFGREAARAQASP